LKKPGPGPQVKAVNKEGMFLEVANLGRPADFSARIELIAGIDKVHRLDGSLDFQDYAGVWERSRGPTTALAEGERDRLIVGRVEGGPPHLPAAHTFKMAFFDEFSACFAEYGTTGWLDGIAGIFPPRLELRVTISSSRGPGKPYVNTFVVDADDPKMLRDETPFTTGYAGIRVWHY
jgi:hypothetical protein